ncbi:MAG: nickel pincer cofactor biosynthesis protein LarC [Candidatus Latescibacterota bacterium]|jgi:hypothetical protein
MRIALFDCFAGISGDMVLGALVDAGLDPALLQAELAKLGVPGLEVSFSRTSRQGIAATLAAVRLGGETVQMNEEHHLELDPAGAAEPHEHRHGHGHDDDSNGHKHPDGHSHRDHDHPHEHGHKHPTEHKHHGESAAPTGGHGHHRLEDLLERIRVSGLDPEVQATASRVFQRLAEAEARVHGVPPDQVRLHEVGSLDALADVVGAVAGLRLLGVERVYSSPLRLGTGYVDCAHGRYPVPVPGVVALCAGVPCEQTEIRGEMVTPTGAAVITTIAASFGPPPLFRQTAVGYGAGRRDRPELPNLLRIRLGETEAPLEQDRLVVIEASIDDMNPEVFGYLFDLLLEQGARDVFVTPVLMKKGRPGSVLSVLVDEDRRDHLIDAVLRETTTLGVRFHAVDRRKLERAVIRVATPYGEVRVKTGTFDGRRRFAPEYEDCARLARQHRVPLLSVYAAAHAALPRE